MPPDLPLVLVDGLLIEQLLVNLLDNAFKYTPPDSAVEVTAPPPRAPGGGGGGGRGPGLPAGRGGAGLREVLPGRIHAAGLRPRPADRRPIVTAHGGTDLAGNRSPRGAVFRFTLPAAEPAPPPEDDRERA